MAGTFSNTLIHIVFSTKNRENLIPETFEQELYAYMGGTIKNERGKLLSAGGTENHIHLLIQISPAISISELVKKIKGNSSTWVNKERKLPYHFLWQAGFGCFSVSESVKGDVIEYIKNQKEHHKNVSFQDEFIAFLKRNNVEYDEKYIWT